MKKIDFRSDKLIYIIIVLLCFMLYFLWSVIIPFNHAPDEEMRYQIPQFIYQYGKLPVGDDARIRNFAWGISYGFTPILSYIISAVFMKIVSFFSTTDAALLIAARFVSVCFSTGTVIFCIKIGKILFKGIYTKLFVISVALLPQFVFISAYVNNDSFGIFTVSWIIYAMIDAKQKKWSLASCLFLGAGIGLCLMSYYNCYGIILVAIIYCIKSVLDDGEIDHKMRFIAKRIVWVMIPAIIISGWWFVRNYIIYDGDFIGLSASKKCGEQYAWEDLKPSNRNTPSRMGISIFEMIFGRVNELVWIVVSTKSFIGVFDYMNLLLKPSDYYLMCFIFLIGFLGILLAIIYRKNNDKILLKVTMFIMCIITLGLSLYYSYFNDYQPQGRYLLPMLISLNILLVSGWYKFSSIIFKKQEEKFALVLIYTYIILIYSATIDVMFTTYGIMNLF